MTLENKLFELTTLVDYGTYYLKNKTVKDLTLEQAVNEFDGGDIIRYLIRDDWGQYMLDEIGSYRIVEYVRNNIDLAYEFDTDEILGMLDSYSVKDYVKDNFDADDIFDENDMLDTMSPDTILDYLANSEPDTIVDWVKSNYNTSDLVDVSGIDWK